MKSLLQPYVFGVLVALIIALGLWLAVPLLLVSVTNNPGLWFPVWLVLPPLLVGGYVSATQMRSRYTSRYLLMGGIVGVTVMLFVFFVSVTSGEIWFSIFIILAGGAVSMFGAYVGKYTILKKRERTP